MYLTKFKCYNPYVRISYTFKGFGDLVPYIHTPPQRMGVEKKEEDHGTS